MSAVRIVSFTDEAFADRSQAARALAAELTRYRDKDTLVLGIPRGGVVIAAGIAGALGCEFDIVLARKIGAPGNPELAIGAVGEDGQVYISRSMQLELDITDAYIESEKERQLAEIKRRASVYRTALPRRQVEGRTVILTDDGLATGATMQAALRTLRHGNPKKAVVAVPVAPRESLESVGVLADEVVCLRVPAFFGALGQFYGNFEQVSDQDILDMVRAAK